MMHASKYRRHSPFNLYPQNSKIRYLLQTLFKIQKVTKLIITTRRRRWPNSRPTLGQVLLSVGLNPIYITHSRTVAVIDQMVV